MTSQKENRPMTSKEALKAFAKVFDQLAYRHDRHTVFDDFLEFSLLMMNLNKKAEDFAELETRWPDSSDQKLFMELFLRYSEAADNDGTGFHDPLGDFFMEYLSNDRNGQFFTPESITVMMAQITCPDLQPGQSVCDPTCGSARGLLAAARIERKAKFYGADIDLRCCKMSVLNMLANSMEGEIAWMNTLSMEHWKSWHIRTVPFGTHRLPHYFVTGPGETHFIERLRTIHENKAAVETVPSSEPIATKHNQLILF